MKKLLNNKLFKNYAILLTYFSIVEILFRYISNIAIYDVSLIRIFIGINIISLFISYILSWTKNGVAKALIITICFLVSFYTFFQMGFNNFIGVYASVNTSSQLGAVTDYIKDFFASFKGIYYLMFIPFILLVIFFLLIKVLCKNNRDIKFPLKKSMRYEGCIKTITTVILLSLFSFAYNETLTVSFMQSELQTVSNKELFNYPSVPSLVINQFGVLGYGLLDIKSLYTEEPTLSIDETSIAIKPKDREFDDTYWNTLISEEKDNTKNTLNLSLINNTITGTNEYTGLFKNKNLIVIMMESVNDIIINEELYPNFYKMYNEGITFKNNYSPRNSCATGNNEFSGLTGLYSIQNNCTANKYKENKYFTSLFNLFNNKGYKTSSMHNYTENYYYRSKIHENLGSGKYYGVEDLGIEYFNEYKNWSSDEDFLEVAMDITLNNLTEEPFMLWLTTVSSHQPYGVSSIEGDKYLSITENTDYPEDLRHYMSKLKTLDNALGILLTRLESAHILDDTVIVLFGDHYPYGLKNSTINYVLDYDLSDYEVERTPMVIYNSKTPKETVTKYSSYINLTPTIANLFDLDFDPRYYMGMDVFSKDYLDLVIFADGSWKNSVAFYNASNSSIKYYSDKTLSVDEIKEINNIVTLRMQTSTSIIKSNYFEYLDSSLKEVKSNSNILASGG